MQPRQPVRPAALAALDAYPLLLDAAAGASLAQQGAFVAERAATFVGRRETLAHLDAALDTLKDGGLIALEGPPGSGVTSLLAHLAATRPFAFWFCDEDTGQGAVTLCAQLIALHHARVPLVPPAAATDPSALKQFLSELATAHTTDDPIVLLIDSPSWESQPRQPLRPLLPSFLPSRIVLIYGCMTGAPLPMSPHTRIVLPTSGDKVHHDHAHALGQAGCKAEWHRTLVAAAEGNFLALHLAYGLLHSGMLDAATLRPGLDAIHTLWWERLDNQGQRLALMLAAAGEPLDLELCASLLGSNPAPLLDAWGRLVQIRQQPGEREHKNNDTPAPRNAAAEMGDALPAHIEEMLTESCPLTPCVSFYHWTTRDFVARQQPGPLRQMHAELAARATQPTSSDQTTAYLARQFARHAALGTPRTRQHDLATVAQRAWIRNQERRHNTLDVAAHDLAWHLRALTDPLAYQEQIIRSDTPAPLTEVLLQLGRSSLLAGTLSSLARAMPGEAAVAALSSAVEQMGRENGLKQVLSRVEQLPDGQIKAQVLRLVGEACYASKMKSSAMRLLSQALDLEEQRVPRSWRDQRDQLLLAMVHTALEHNETEAALEISEHIAHIEQRGMAETSVARHLLGQGALVRARKVASAVLHENLGAWAQAEVAVAVARSGDMHTAEILLGDIQVETARAWAHIELACDTASHDEAAARQRIEQLESRSQHDHGLARLSEALALADKDGDALATAEEISDVALRVSALLNLRLSLDGLVAMLALEQASKDIGSLTNDERVPLITMLAAAYAAMGHHDKAVDVAHQFPEGEERDRAFSRVAVALTQAGKHSEGLAIARGLEDSDERDWTLDELARVLSANGYWQEAQALALEISDEKDRARSLANLSIALARTSAPLAALWLTHKIDIPSERIRALIFIAPMLVKDGHSDKALEVMVATSGNFSPDEHLAQGIRPAQLDRYLAAIAVALAEQGEIARAQHLVAHIAQPFEQARVLLAAARQSAPHNPAHAFATLGAALRLAVVEREHAFRLVGQAMPAMATMGGAAMLTRLTAAVTDIDSWW